MKCQKCGSGFYSKLLKSMCGLTYFTLKNLEKTWALSLHFAQFSWKSTPANFSKIWSLSKVYTCKYFWLFNMSVGVRDKRIKDAQQNESCCKIGYITVVTRGYNSKISYNFWHSLKFVPNVFASPFTKVNPSDT